MSVEMRVHWTCDRCGAATDVQPTTPHPAGWGSVCHTTVSPNSAPMEGSWWQRSYLCLQCKLSFTDWLRGGAEEEDVQ